MDQNQIDILIYQGHEDRNTEYNKSMCWTDMNTKAKVLKAVLSFANTPGGGYLIFGVGEDPVCPRKHMATGMTQEDFDSFNENDVRDFVGAYTHPAADVRVIHREIEDKRFVVMCVQESALCPVMCGKNGPEINSKPCVREGCLYSRPASQKVQSRQVCGGHDWTAIVERCRMRYYEEHVKHLPCRALGKLEPTKEELIEQYRRQREESQ